MISEYMREKAKKYKIEAIIMSIYALLLYSFFMTQQLTNNIDGFWQQNYYLAGEWEVSCGRWLWPYIDKLLFGIHNDPLTSISALALFILGYILILDIFQVNNHKIQVLGGLIFLSSPVILVFLSYRYMAVTFATSFLFAVLAGYFLVKIESHAISVLLAMLFTCFSMSIYQAHLAIVCILGLSFIIHLCIKNKSSNTQIALFIKLGLTIIGGGGLYYFFLHAYLKITGFQLSNYNNISNISLLSILKHFPRRVCEAYTKFFLFFMNGVDGWFMNTIFAGKIVYISFFFFLACLCIMILIYIYKRNRWHAVITFLCLLTLPLGATASLLITEVTRLQPQMCCPLIITVILLLLLAQSIVKQSKEVTIKLIHKCFLMGFITHLFVVFLYGSSIQNLIDQNAMYEGKTATVAMFTQVIDDLEEAGAISDEHALFFIGKPCKNKYFKVSPLYNQANAYAKVGDFSISDTGMYAFYQALLNKLMYIDANVLCVDYEDMAFEEYYQSMPCYPEQGYFVVWDTVIVKISEP